MDSRGKRLLFLALGVVILFLGVTGYFIFYKKDSPATGVDVGKSLFPYDQRSATINQLPVVGGDEGPSVTISAEQVPISSRERLRKVTSFPVSGFVSFTTSEQKTSMVVDEKTGKERQVVTPIVKNHIRYNDRRTGFIFDGIVSDESILNTQITKTGLPAAEELIFNTGGNIGFLRYEQGRTIQTFKLIIPPPPTLPVYCKSIPNTGLRIGSKGAAVKVLQTYINSKLGTKLSLDGVYGKKTSGYIQQIQKSLFVAETGIIDETTHTAIVTECDTVQKQVDEARNSPIELKGSLMDGVISQMSTLGDSVFFLQKSGQKLQGFLQKADGDAAAQVFENSFGEWMPQFVNKNLVTLTTYASGYADGYLYALDPENKTFRKLYGPAVGLTTLMNPKGTIVLVTSVENNQLVTKLVILATGEEKVLPFVTFPEKCSWYSDDQLYCGVPNRFITAIYPDRWYQGVVGFSDSLWGYTVSTSRAVQLATPSESLDIFRIQSYPESQYLFFMNKNTYELWSYRLGDSGT